MLSQLNNHATKQLIRSNQLNLSTYLRIKMIKLNLSILKLGILEISKFPNDHVLIKNEKKKHFSFKNKYASFIFFIHFYYLKLITCFTLTA